MPTSPTDLLVPPHSVCLNHHDIAQHLLHLNLAHTTYEPPEPIYLRQSFNQSPQRIRQLCLQQEQTPERSYLLTLLTETSLGTTTHYTATRYTALSSTAPTASSFLLSSNHPLLQNAPPLPPYLHLPGTFLHTTATTLTIPQSHHLITLLFDPFGIPAPTPQTWTLPLTVALKRSWPTPANPFAAQLVISHPGNNTTPTLSIPLPQCDSPIPRSYTPLHKNALLSSILSSLNLTIPNAAWRLSTINLDTNSKEYVIDFSDLPSTTSPSSPPDQPYCLQHTAFHNYVQANLSLVLNNPTNPPRQTLRVSYSPLTASHLHTVHLWDLVDTEPPVTNPATFQTWLNTELQKLNQIPFDLQLQQISC